MTFVTPDTPNLVDFMTFIENDVQIPTAALPTNSPYLGYAFTQAQAFVLCPPCGVVGVIFSLATYNCATAILFQITPDQSGQTYFADARSNKPSENFPNGGFGLNTMTLGLVTSASDEGTSGALKTPDWATGLTIGQLQFFQTTWGREYLSYQQSYGSNIVGVT